MTKYALIIDGRVDTISFENTDGWLEVPEDVFGGFVLQADGTFINPDIPEPVSPFKDIEPVPFWNAAFDMFTPPLKKSDVLASIEDPDERYLAELAIEGRKTYVRYDPFVVSLAERQGLSAFEMDTTWLYVQENYK